MALLLSYENMQGVLAMRDAVDLLEQGQDFFFSHRFPSTFE